MGGVQVRGFKILYRLNPPKKVDFNIDFNINFADPVCDFSDSYLVDPASSYMLVSKIKPCKSKYKSLYDKTADGSLKQL